MSVVAINPGLAKVVGAFPSQHRAANMLAYLARYHPQPVERYFMMSAGAFAENIQGKFLAYASFEYWILRLDDELRLHGWRLDDTGEIYRLVKF